MITESLKNRVSESKSSKQLISNLKSSLREMYITGAAGSLKSIIVSNVHDLLTPTMLCVVPTLERAETLKDELDQFLPETRVTIFEHVGRQGVTDVGAAPGVIGRRLEAVKTLLLSTTPVVICTARALTERIPNPKAFKDSILFVNANEELDFDEFITKLVELGYTREYMIDRPGEISVRGGIVDVFPHSREYPLRIEFLGDTVESIREFDVHTQRSLNGRDHVAIIAPLSSGFDHLIIQDDGSFDLSKTGTILDYLCQDALVMFFESAQIEQEILEYNQEIEKTLARSEAMGSPNSKTLYRSFFVPQMEVDVQLSNFTKLYFESFVDHRKERIIDYNAQRREQLSGNLKLLKAEIEQDNKFKTRNIDQPFLTAFLCENDSQKKRMKYILDEDGLDFADFNVATLRISEGFRYPEGGLSVYTSHEFYGRSTIPRTSKSSKIGFSKQSLTSFKKGDFVVHIDHGIGRFQGLEKISVWGAERESLKIEYRDKDHLYVPLEKMDRVQKHSSKDGFQPTLSKLGTAGWERLKSRTKKRVKDIAEELIRLYALRRARKGFAFSEDSTWQTELEASFVYEDTPDQIKAIQDIKKDMQNDRPMDRLVCGDVGYGKTEVAIRAAFKVITDSKQVAVLVPTTILAQQHYNTFRERMERFPVEIEMLSRFRSAKQQKEIIEATKVGKIDVLIGTHRILSKDVEFKNLGLLVVDEEQKFGVVHKEKLKLLRSTVDVLTLTATPIPRTLHMAIMGGRDMSLISTPPRDRHPIVTEVAHFDKQLIREAILGEVARGGQIFFVHNRVQSIHAVTTLLRDLVPEVSFCIAHGQMKESELERVMIDFLKKKHHCLVSTMIIESGMDLTNVNTLIVNRADRFGLAQLYQLRGRVGRSTHQAFAYLLIPPLKRITRNALKRLQTIQEFTHLGAGYNIAMRDLEIRGAGNLLGAEQSGFMDALGFDLYCKIVNEAVEELKQEHLKEKPKEPDKKEIDTIIKIDCDAYLPKKFINIEGDRVDLYTRLVEAKDLSQIDDIQNEIRDRFGRLPYEAKNLLEYISIKIITQNLGISRLLINRLEMKGLFDSSVTPSVEQFNAWSGKMVAKVKQPFRFVPKDNQLWFKVNLTNKGEKLSEAKKFLQTWL